MSEFKVPTGEIIVFCDGACSGNPGPGGWGTIIVTPDGKVRELGGGERQTTNNQMELSAATAAIEFLENVPGKALIYTDSVYVIRGITQWIWGWMRRGWLTAEGKDVQNKEYWQALSSAVGRRKNRGALEWKFVRGHSGVPGNDRCDEIAVAYSKGQSVRLFNGSLLKYDVPVLDLPPDVPLPEPRDFSKGEKKAAFSYLSLLGGTPMRHSTWPDCEKRVKGQPGAKFKKAMSESEESEILKSWGVDPSKLKT